MTTQLEDKILQVAESPDHESEAERQELYEAIAGFMSKHGTQEFKRIISDLMSVFDKGKFKDFVKTGDRALQHGEPNTTQLRIINSKLPEPVDSSEVKVATFAASHNLISISQGVWDLDSLVAMAKLFPQGNGRPFEIDHEWYSVEAAQGLIFDARLMQSETAPKAIQDFQDFSKHNKKIVKRDGYVWLEIDVVYEAESEFARSVKFGRIRDVSTGGLKDPNGIGCPMCSEEHGELVHTFTDDRCPHIPPLPYMSWFMDLDDPEIQSRLMPYYIRCGFHTAIEVSAVLVGDLPGAQLILPQDRNYGA